MPADRAQRCAIAVMAKAPRAGRVKTRLTPPLAPDEATALSACFLRDVTANIALAGRIAPIDGFIAYAPAGSGAQFDGMLEPGTGLVLADGSRDAPPGVDGFGRCLLDAVRGLFELGYGAVCLLNADGPTVSTEFLVEAATRLAAAGERVVLGPADDGGYYLIGMQAPHAALFRGVAWSTALVANQTRARIGELGLELVTLPSWYDVDDVATLRTLVAELDGVASPRGQGYAAPVTARWLVRHDIRARLAGAAEPAA
ncbi:MAG: glycosyltransferase [Proteobacteria bacterium]|nr:glycosyltransferase [Pseudomonadota bacterium]